MTDSNVLAVLLESHRQENSIHALPTLDLQRWAPIPVSFVQRWHEPGRSRSWPDCFCLPIAQNLTRFTVNLIQPHSRKPKDEDHINTHLVLAPFGLNSAWCHSSPSWGMHRVECGRCGGFRHSGRDLHWRARHDLGRQGHLAQLTPRPVPLSKRPNWRQSLSMTFLCGLTKWGRARELQSVPLTAIHGPEVNT